ncbi:MAG: selenocysteine-specific translation elongation factor [Burkholderiales bacterium]|nr:selenocysteine-specific translation elongation factor [Burkholderiales bacterium]
MIIGTAGHIDHGKTALVKALTGVDADRLKEEKVRGITIDLGYAYTPLPNGDILGFIDVPGHEKLVHNMLAGATGIDFVLLAIAADDGPMPQTREHLAILDLLGLNRGAVALTKIDCVSPARVDEARLEIATLLDGTQLQDSPIFPLSSLSGAGIPALRAHLEQTATAMPPREARGYFRLAVDRVFTLPGTGTVVTGTVFAGEVHVEDKLVLSPKGIPLRVRGIHTQNRAADSGRMGQRCALNIVGAQLEKQDVHRGDWVLGAALHQPIQRLDARLRLLPSEAKALKHWSPVHFHLGASDVTARVALLEGETLQPGADMLAQIVIDKPVCAVHGDRFIVRDQSASRTLGGGMVLDIFPPARNRRKPERIAVLHSLETADAGSALAAALEHSTEGVDLERFARNWNLRADEIAALQSSLPMRSVANWACSATRWETLKQILLARLAEMHQKESDTLGPDRERLRRMALPTAERPVFAALLDELLRDGQIAQSGPWLHLPEHKVRLSANEEKLWLKVRPMLAETPFQPPRVRDIARSLLLEEDKTRLLMKRVSRTGQTYLVAHDHYFTREAVEALADIVRELAEAQGAASAAEFRDRIGTGRKLAIQILECFDRMGYTQRIGDAHRPRPGTTTFTRHAVD